MGSLSRRHGKIWTGLETKFQPGDDLPTRRFKEDLNFMIRGGGLIVATGRPGAEDLADAIRQQPFLKGTTHFSGKRDLTAEGRQLMARYGL